MLGSQSELHPHLGIELAVDAAGVLEVCVYAFHHRLPVRREELHAQELVHADQPVAVGVQHRKGVARLWEVGCVALGVQGLGFENWGLGVLGFGVWSLGFGG